MDEHGNLRGWALLAADPVSDLDLDLYGFGVHVATTTANKPHFGVDRLLRAPQRTNPAFEFGLTDFRGDGALELIRPYGDVPPAGLEPGKPFVRISGTLHALPPAMAMTRTAVLPERAGAAILQVAARQLQRSVANDQDIDGLGPFDRDLLLESRPLFSSEWYGDTFGDVAVTGLAPAEHYRSFGSALGRAAGP